MITSIWPTRRLRYLGVIAKGRLPSETSPSQLAQGDLPYLSMEYLRGETMTPAYVSQREGLLCADVNDLLLLWDGSNAGEFLTAKRGIVSSTVARIQPQGVQPRFLFYVCKAVEPVVRAQTVGMGVPHVDGELLKSLRLPLPPDSEQRVIADFLDRETAKLDTLVEKKRELIEKLKEKRTALISRTVTRGLNANVKLKPSGIEWLGDIPEHWELVRLGRRIMLQRGVDITKDEQNEGTVPVVSSGGISSYHDRALVKGPGVVVGRKGTAGAVHYVEQDFWPHDTTLYVKEFRGNDHRYVYYKLVSMDLESYDTGSANPTVNRNRVHPEIVSWPPSPEQRAIADYLDRETAKIDQMMEKVEAAIEKLQEYRTALITAAATGKIDVRKAAHSAGSTPAEAASTLPL